MIKSPLLATKTYLPMPSGGLVSRPRLLAKLDAAFQNRCRLIYVSAPAGTGKSTLLAEWVTQAAIPVAWLSLDVEDNEINRFWSYCLVAIRTRIPGFGETLMQALVSAQPPPASDFLPIFLNLLSEIPYRLLLVLDDYLVIDQPTIHQSLAFFIEHLPPTIQVAIATRIDPPLPVHRWRARNQLVELRASDLRFTEAEMSIYFRQFMQLDVSDEDIHLLEESTEGWAVGLHLAALSLQEQANPHDFIRRFSGSHHYVLEYLTAEVLASQPEHVQDFLVRTSFLKNYCVDLVQSVTGLPDCQSIVAMLRQKNLFIVTLDENNTWFRYHHLFADLLQLRLAIKPEGQKADLHHKAAVWYEQHDLFDEAISHFMAASQPSQAVSLILNQWQSLMTTGQPQRVVKWIDALPSGWLEGNPLLCILYSWMLIIVGRGGEILPLIMNARRILDSHTQAEDSEMNRFLWGGIAALQASLAAQQGDLESSRKFAEEALSQSEDPNIRSVAWISIASAFRQRGEYEMAISNYLQAIPILESIPNYMGLWTMLYTISRVYQVQGELPKAEMYCQHYLNQARQVGLNDCPGMGLLEIELAEIAYQRNEMETARTLFAQGVEKSRLSGQVDLRRNTRVIEAKLLRYAGDLPGAVAILTEAMKTLSSEDVPNLARETGALLALYQAEMGDLRDAEIWATRTKSASSPMDHPQRTGYTRGLELMALTRVLVLLGQIDEAFRIAARMEESAILSNSKGWQVEAQMLQAEILWKQQKPECALEKMEDCLDLAEQAGLVRMFLDEGDKLAPVVVALAKSGNASQSIKVYLYRLLDSLPPKTGTGGNVSHPLGNCPLTERELDVLRCLAGGQSNPEIARRLVLSLATVKTHLIHIYTKLGVDNRAQAVLLAKELRII